VGPEARNESHEAITGNTESESVSENVLNVNQDAQSVSIVTDETSQNSVENSGEPRRYPERVRKPTKFFHDQFAYFAHQFDSPSDLFEAMSSKSKDRWKEAMQEGLDSFGQNEVWTLVEKPVGKNVVQNKWVFHSQEGC